jgi:hypothetical protein
MSIRSIPFIFITCFNLISTQAATYYVDARPGINCNGNYSIVNRSCNGADGYSYTTISSGVQAMSSGDTLNIRAGTYTDQPVAVKDYQSGTGTGATPYTIIRGYQSERPILRGSTTTSIDGIASYFNSGGQAHHIEYRGLEITNVATCFWLGKLHHVNIIDNVCYDTYGFFIYTDPAAVSDVYVANNYVYRIGKNQPGYPPGNNAIYAIGSNAIIENNRFEHTCAAIFIYSSAANPAAQDNVIVRNNIVRWNARADLDPWQIGSTCGPAIGAGARGDNLQIYNNIIWDSSFTATYPMISTHQGQNNSYFPTNVKVYNNTIVGGAGGQLGVVFNGGSGTLRNNIIYGVNTPFSFLGSSSVSFSHNHVTGNPSFVNAAAGDFRLQSTSPARNTGTFVSGVTTDFAGNARPQEGFFDIGAYEFIAEISASAKPLAPKNLNVK